MTTVTINETPAQQVIAKATAEVSVKDVHARVIKLKKPGILAQFRIVEVAGDSASNRVYMNMVLPLIYVTELGGEPVTQPANKLQLEALIQRLDEYGVDAVMTGVREHFGQQEPEKDKAEIKK